MQVILAFSQPFWPAGFFDVVCTDCFMPEFWVTHYPATSSDPATAGLCCITGFVAGARAKDMSHLSQTTVVTQSLAQLDQIFGGCPNTLTGRSFDFSLTCPFSPLLFMQLSQAGEDMEAE